MAKRKGVKTKPQTATFEVTHTQFMCGRSSGKYGMSCYEWTQDGDKRQQLTGVDLGSLLDRNLGHGAKLLVTVSLKKNAPFKKNPWLKKEKTGSRLRSRSQRH